MHGFVYATLVIESACAPSTNDSISSPEQSLPLSSGTGKRTALGKSISNNRILVISGQTAQA